MTRKKGQQPRRRSDETGQKKIAPATQAVQKRTQIAKERTLAALEKTMGVVTNACQAAGTSRSQFYEWLKSDPEFKRRVEDIEDQALDFAESKMYTLINGVKVQTEEGNVYEMPPDRTMIIFLLKTKGKKRGYIERQEHGHFAMGEPITGAEFILDENKDTNGQDSDT